LYFIIAFHKEYLIKQGTGKLNIAKIICAKNVCYFFDFFFGGTNFEEKANIAKI
jgi:hypothetical protein